MEFYILQKQSNLFWHDCLEVWEEDVEDATWFTCLERALVKANDLGVEVKILNDVLEQEY